MDQTRTPNMSLEFVIGGVGQGDGRKVREFVSFHPGAYGKEVLL